MVAETWRILIPLQEKKNKNLKDVELLLELTRLHLL